MSQDYILELDGSNFFSCTTCIVYQYVKELMPCFSIKAGAKVQGFAIQTKYNTIFFQSFFERKH